MNRNLANHDIVVVDDESPSLPSVVVEVGDEEVRPQCRARGDARNEHGAPLASTSMVASRFNVLKTTVPAKSTTLATARNSSAIAIMQTSKDGNDDEIDDTDDSNARTSGRATNESREQRKQASSAGDSSLRLLAKMALPPTPSSGAGLKRTLLGESITTSTTAVTTTASNSVSVRNPLSISGAQRDEMVGARIVAREKRASMPQIVRIADEDEEERRAKVAVVVIVNETAKNHVDDDSGKSTTMDEFDDGDNDDDDNNNNNKQASVTTRHSLAQSSIATPVAGELYRPPAFQSSPDHSRVAGADAAAATDASVDDEDDARRSGRNRVFTQRVRAASLEDIVDDDDETSEISDAVRRVSVTAVSLIAEADFTDAPLDAVVDADVVTVDDEENDDDEDDRDDDDADIDEDVADLKNLQFKFSGYVAKQPSSTNVRASIERVDQNSPIRSTVRVDEIDDEPTVDSKQLATAAAAAAAVRSSTKVMVPRAHELFVSPPLAPVRATASGAARLPVSYATAANARVVDSTAGFERKNNDNDNIDSTATVFSSIISADLQRSVPPPLAPLAPPPRRRVLHGRRVLRVHGDAAPPTMTWHSDAYEQLRALPEHAGLSASEPITLDETQRVRSALYGSTVRIGVGRLVHVSDDGATAVLIVGDMGAIVELAVDDAHLLAGVAAALRDKRAVRFERLRCFSVRALRPPHDWLRWFQPDVDDASLRPQIVFELIWLPRMSEFA